MRGNLVGVALWVTLSACTGDNVFTIPEAPLSKEPTPTTPTTPIPTTEPTTEPITTPEPDPCIDLPTAPLSLERVDGVSPSEEFALDASGDALNLPDNASAVFRTPFGGPSTFVTPFDAVEIAGVRVLLDGDLAVANEWSGAVERVDLQTGARTVIVAGLNGPNSLAVGPDGLLYVGAYSEIVRVDPETLAVEEIFEAPGADIDGLTFSPDYRILYFNSDEDGLIAKLAINEDGTIGQAGLHAEVSAGFWSELDGMATDTCGNLFVARVDGRIYRVDPTGMVDEYVELDTWATALSFGSGVGGWQRDHLYVMDRSEGLVDVEVGVEGRDEPHLGE